MSNPNKTINLAVANFWLDVLLLVLFLILAFTCAVIRLIFPPLQQAEAWSLWGWNLDRWIEFQFSILCVFSFGILLHLMLHWKWVCGIMSTKILWSKAQKKTRMDDGTRTLIGVGFMIVVLAVFGAVFALAATMVDAPR